MPPNNSDAVALSKRSLGTIEWSANVMLWVGGIVLAVSPSLAKSSWEIFALMLLGQLFWAGAAFLIKKWSLFASSIFFVALNLYAIFVRI